MAELYLWLRFVKWVGVLTLFAGTALGLSRAPLEHRRRGVIVFGLPGFALTWASGFLLAWITGVSLFSTWILGSLALSFVALQVLLYGVGKPERGGPIAAAVAMGMLTGCVALMVFKPV